MKKVVLFLTMALCLAACGGDDDEPTSPTQDAVNEISSMLKGKYISISESQSDNIITHIEITFNPYSSPRKEKWLDGSIEKDVDIFGECDLIKYYNDHLLETSEHWKYNITIAYNGAQPRLYFYPETYGRNEMHYFTKLSPISFKLDNDIYNKE